MKLLEDQQPLTQGVTHTHEWGFTLLSLGGYEVLPKFNLYYLSLLSPIPAVGGFQTPCYVSLSGDGGTVCNRTWPKPSDLSGLSRPISYHRVLGLDPLTLLCSDLLVYFPTTDMADQPRSRVIKNNPIGNGLNAFRASFNPACGEVGRDIGNLTSTWRI